MKVQSNLCFFSQNLCSALNFFSDNNLSPFAVLCGMAVAQYNVQGVASALCSLVLHCTVTLSKVGS